MTVKKTKDTDYLFLSSYIHAREARAQDGAADKEAVFRELSSLAPDKRIVDFFRLKYDYHNAKVFLKSIAANADNSRLYSPLSRFAPAVMTEAYRSERYDGLPAAFGAALRSADDTLARTGDPRLADFILDKAYVQELKETAAAANSAFLSGYAGLYADALNLRALVRMLKSGVRAEQLAAVLTDCGTVSVKSIAAAFPDAAAVLALYRGTALAALLPEAERAAKGEGFSAFENACRAALAAYMNKAKYDCFGERVLIRYLYELEENPA